VGEVAVSDEEHDAAVVVDQARQKSMNISDNSAFR